MHVCVYFNRSFPSIFSDDRSAEIFQQRLEAATQMQAVLTPDCRPTCLIIDEIDGAPSVSTHVHMCKISSVCVCVYIGLAKRVKQSGNWHGYAHYQVAE